MMESGVAGRTIGRRQKLLVILGLVLVVVLGFLFEYEHEDDDENDFRKSNRLTNGYRRAACSPTPVCASIPHRQLKTSATRICGAGEKSDEHQLETNPASCDGSGLPGTWEQRGV